MFIACNGSYKLLSLHHQIRKAQSGVALIELLVALVLFVVSLVVLSQMQMRSVMQSFDNHQRSIALWQGKALIARMSANNSPAALAAYQKQLINVHPCTSSPPKQCEGTLANPDVAACDTQDMAGFDVWVTFCGDSGLDSELVDYTAELNCPGGCIPGANINLRITWISKATDSDSGLREAKVNHDGVATDANLDFISLDFRS